MSRLRASLVILGLALWATPVAAGSNCGLTIITPGWQEPHLISGAETFPDWAFTMADAIKERTGSTVPIYRLWYNPLAPPARLLDGDSDIDITATGGAIVLLDWSDLSYATTQDSQLYADVFFNYLYGQLHNGHNLAELPVHFIGHSRGTGVNARIVYLLAQYGILVDQVTTLDPHPTIVDWEPETYSNILFADNYWQAHALSFPDGHPIDGAFNQDLSYVIDGSGATPHSHVHTYYHGTIDLGAASDGAGDSINPNWYQFSPRDLTGYNFNRQVRPFLSRPASGLSQYISGAGGTGSRVPVALAGTAWANAGVDQRNILPSTVTVGQTVNIPYYFADRDSSETITFRTDSDTNAFNGVEALLGSVTQTSRPETQIAAGTFAWTPTVMDVGTHNLQVRGTDAAGSVRYDYFLRPITVVAAPAPAPTITSLSPASLLAISTPQQLTISGANFIPAGQPNASTLVFYDPANNPYYRTPSNVTVSSMQYSINVGSAAGTWKVKVVNGSLESALYSFTVTSNSAALTGLSISGPAAIPENDTGQFTAKAFYSDGSSATVTSAAVWSENSSATSISSGFLTCGSVSADTNVTVGASFTAGGITKTASVGVVVLNSSSSGGTVTSEVLSNGNFESQYNSWSVSGYADIVNLSYPHAGSWYGYLGNVDNAGGALSQFFPVPASASAATLSFYLDIFTNETGGLAFDKMKVDLVTGSDQFIGTVAQFSNLDKGDNVSGTYTKYTYDIMPLIQSYKGQSVYLVFSGTFDTAPTSIFRIDDVSVKVTTPSPVSLTGLAITGPSSVLEGQAESYQAQAIFSDGTTQQVSPTSWSENSSVTTINDGLLFTSLVNSDVLVTIGASYTFNGVTKQASKQVTVVDANSAHVLSGLSINGPLSLSENTTAQYSATATYMDGTSETVTAVWSENSAATTISAGGLLTAGDVDSDATVLVSASYTAASTTRNASQSVVVSDIPSTPTLSAVSISGPATVNEGSAAEYEATAYFSDGSSENVNPTWSENSAAASISNQGVLFTLSVSADTALTVSASFTAGGVTRSAQKAVTILNLPSIVCGNGLIEYGEQCDDGNVSAGDCCSATCQFEAVDSACPDDGNPCTSDRCDGGSGYCHHIAGNAGTTCRTTTGACDLAETCDGSSEQCPANIGKQDGADCSNQSYCDGAETCSNGSCQPGTPPCPAGQCDEAGHTCTGACANGQVCRMAAGICDQPEYCTDGSCPPDVYMAGGTVCRMSAGVCDVAESCSGTSSACPADARSPSSTTCRGSTGTCDLAEQCTGTSAACPADSFSPTAIVCRAGSGVCDPPERCTGSSGACPAPALSPTTTVCRLSAGACDPAEQCTGTSSSCPADSLAASSSTCRASAGVCDVAEHCTGSSGACPADSVSTSAKVCRQSVDACDPSEQCSGSSAQCPADANDCSQSCIVGTGSAPSCSEAALNFCLPGGQGFTGSVAFNCGDAPASILVTSTKNIYADTRINGAAKITISGGHAVAIFSVTTAVKFTIQNLTIADGNSSNFAGGGILNNGGMLAITNSTFTGNAAVQGGAINSQSGGSLSVANSHFAANSTVEGGGSGGAIFCDAVSILDSTFANNSAWGAGGAIEGGKLTIAGSTFSENTSSVSAGGAIYSYDSSSVADSTFSGNVSLMGGAIRNDGTFTITRSDFAANSATGEAGEGGAVANLGQMTVTDSTFSENSATGTYLAWGSAIFNGGMNDVPGTLSVSNSDFSDNGGRGGALCNYGGSLAVDGSTFSGNGEDGANGGGITAVGNSVSTISQCTFSANRAIVGGGISSVGGSLTVLESTFLTNAASSGGGIADQDGTVAVFDSTFSGNTATSFGGGIFAELSDSLLVTGCTFVGNGAEAGDLVNGGGGGGAILGPQKRLDITNSTFVSNSAPNGGAVQSEATVANITNTTFFHNTGRFGGTIYNAIGASAAVTITNSIFSTESPGGNCASIGGGFVDGGHNIEDESTCGFAGAGCSNSSGTSYCNMIAGFDPAGLRDNGGPTQTIALCTSLNAPTVGCTGRSMAVNRGDQTVCARTTGVGPVSNVDQRHFVRPGSGADKCSIGAFEADFLPDCVNGQMCRAAAGVCDSAEYCDGGACPPDAFVSGSMCRASGGVCDLAESCSGTSPLCPGNSFVASVAVCRTSAGVCDKVEFCSGSSASCPADAKATTICRSSSGICDPAETCSGSSNTCPADAKSTAICRAAFGVCDVAETCNGSTNACPPDALAGSTVVCRAAAGECDVTEKCGGVSSNCPADVFRSASTGCTSDSNPCTNDVCNGSSAVCAHLGNSDQCDDHVFCNGTDLCSGGSCSQHSGSPCAGPDGDSDCQESCNEAGHACNATDPNGSICNDGDGCTKNDKCSAGVCSGPQDPHCVTTTTAPPEPDCGDANGDGRITASDALLTLRTAVNDGECPLTVCDYNGDGKIIAGDALAVLRVAVGQQEPQHNCPVADQVAVTTTLSLSPSSTLAAMP